MLLGQTSINFYESDILISAKFMNLQNSKFQKNLAKHENLANETAFYSTAYFFLFIIFNKV